MNTESRAILSLVAMQRITPAQAERLLIARTVDREAWWFVAGFVLFACLAQLQPHALSGAVHQLKTAIDGAIPAFGHVLAQIAARLGRMGGTL